MAKAVDKKLLFVVLEINKGVYTVWCCVGFSVFVLQVIKMFILCDAVVFVVLQINIGVYSNYTIILYSV